jgi:hypothetical protein
MPIILAVVVLGLLIFASIYAFDWVTAMFGETAAIVVTIIVIALVVWGLVRWIASRREIAPNMRKGEDGDWTHVLKADWGGVRLAAQKGLCDVKLRDETGRYIFADLRGARAQEAGGAWQVLLDVKDAKRGEWTLPMRDKGEAHKWARILSLATQEKL